MSEYLSFNITKVKRKDYPKAKREILKVIKKTFPKEVFNYYIVYKLLEDTQRFSQNMELDI